MARYWDLMAEYDAETKTMTACAGTVSGAASPYSPLATGKLIGLRAVPNSDGATTLLEHVTFKLTSPSFKPVNAIQVGAQGCGLQTAPAFQGGNMALDWEVNLDVVPGNDIKIEAANYTADTPVGVSVMLYGLFEAN